MAQMAFRGFDVDPFGGSSPPPFPLNEDLSKSAPNGFGLRRPSSSGNGGGSNVQTRLDQLEFELARVKQGTQSSLRSSRSVPKLAPLSNAPSAPQVMHMPVPYPMPMPMMNGAGGGGYNGDVSSEHRELMTAHRELLKVIAKQQESHAQLLKAHTDLMAAHTKLTGAGAGGGAPAKKKVKPPSLGVVRLDYDYPAAEGDVDCPASFGYDVLYRVCPKLTFKMAQDGNFTEEVEAFFAEAIKWLEMKGVTAITGDCGFMLAFQKKAREIAKAPVFMSAMVQCPIIATCLEVSAKILILTANSSSLAPQRERLLVHCGFDIAHTDRFVIAGCQNVPGFDAVQEGKKVPLDVVQPGIIKLVAEERRKDPNIRAILLECTELPPYADALREATDLPVWDAITAADFYVSAFQDNPRFGLGEWQEHWDGVQEQYQLGQNLIESEKKILVNQASLKESRKTVPNKFQKEKLSKRLTAKQAPMLGVIRLDYNYPPSKGDIDHPGSYDYAIRYRTVPGLTFEMAQSGHMTPEVEEEFRICVKWLEKQGCVGITGDCGFMMAFQVIARSVAHVPVFLSSMVQCPMVSLAFDEYEKVLILTANSDTLAPQKEVLLNHCGFDVDDVRFQIQGCQDVPGFDAVARGEHVDVARVTPGMVKLVKGILEKQAEIRAILLECTELPPYSDALRQATGLPVFDSITCADFFIAATSDNPRFGMNHWQNEWDGHIQEYTLGQNLSPEERARLLNKARVAQAGR